MGRITIFKTETIKEIPEIINDFTKLKEQFNLKEEQEHISAVVGELAGTAVNILMSPEVQVPLTILGLKSLGDDLWKLIKKLQNTNKVYDLDKEFAKALIVSRSLKKYQKDYKKEYQLLSPDAIKMIGIMEAEPENNKLSKICYKNFDDEGLGDSGIYFMGVVIKRPNDRSITYWHIIRNDGKICSSWITQTYTKNLPNHLQ